jgi:hypothetical protein
MRTNLQCKKLIIASHRNECIKRNSIPGKACLFTSHFHLLLLFLLFNALGISAQQNSNGALLEQVNVSIIDSISQEKTPVRVRITRNGNVVKALPHNAIAVMYGLWDHADGYDFQPDSSFYSDGQLSIALPEGDYEITLSKGIEYLDQRHKFRVVSGISFNQTYTMVRWVNMPLRNWYSADDHIHIRRSPADNLQLMKWIQAEDIHVGVLLRMGDFWATYYDQYAWGEKGIYTEENYLLTSGQEDPRTPELGHALGFGAAAKVRYADEYYYYDRVFDKLHELGGITGYAHHAESFHGYRGLMLDGLRRKIDALEILQYCVSEDPLHTLHYYHLLDLGYAVTAIAGSDFPWCGKDHDGGSPERNARIGNARFYTLINKPFSFEAWNDAVHRGHTFVTSGPMIAFAVNGKLPGDTLHVTKGSKIIINAQALGHEAQVPLQRLEIVKHGKIIGSAKNNDVQQSSEKLSIEMSIDAAEGFWIAARAYAGDGQAAHTTPVYVSVDQNGFHNKITLSRYLDLGEQYLQELQREIDTVNSNPEYQSWRFKKGLEKRIADARAVIKQLRTKIK